MSGTEVLERAATGGAAGVLGWEWRRTRLIPGEIKELKAQLPPADEEGKRPPSPIQEQIEALEKVRDSLSAFGGPLWFQTAMGELGHARRMGA